MRERQLSSTAHPIPFFLNLTSDGKTGATGLSPTVTISKDGAAFAAAAGAVSEIGNGWYALAGHATDRNTLGAFLIHATAGTADPYDAPYEIVGCDPFDAIRLGLTSLPSVAQGSTGALPTGDASGRTTIAPAGLDSVTKMGGYGIRQQINLILGVLLGKRSGVPALGIGGTVTLNDPTNAVALGTVTVDTAGNITSTALTPPA